MHPVSSALWHWVTFPVPVLARATLRCRVKLRVQVCGNSSSESMGSLVSCVEHEQGLVWLGCAGCLLELLLSGHMESRAH